MMQRPYTKESLDLCEFIKLLGKKLWVDYDDALFHVNPENKTHLLYENQQTRSNIVKILGLSDVVTVTNEYLRQTYAGCSDNIVVVPNAFNDDLIKRGEITKREKMVLWRGGDTHIYDLMQHGTALNQTIESHPDYEFLFLGYYPWFLSKTNNKGYIAPMDIILFFDKLFKIKPSLIHVPLNDDTFNRCRSNTAYIEAAFSGAVCVCPSWWNLPGSLPYSDITEYYSSMEAVLRGEVDIEKMNAESWEVINECFLLSKVNKKRVELLNNLR
jgi:hypothetical protein